jgi:pyruvate formate-lyase activating enzyme-like uncharacterized protein
VGGNYYFNRFAANNDFVGVAVLSCEPAVEDVVQLRTRITRTAMARMAVFTATSLLRGKLQLQVQIASRYEEITNRQSLQQLSKV